tara:strand:+ start:3247 stop:4008 length:762 start_codon:yes stop_codon:yes gene_type:complete
MFFSSKLNKFKNLRHSFFSRKNGVSKGYYESLNCGLGSRDKKEDVLKNLELVSKKIHCEKKSLITLNQRHSNKVVHFKNKSDVKNKLAGDAIVCEVKNIGISILAADCAPILFYDPKKKIIGCAHAGWKGALRGIIKETVKKFNELNSNNDDLIAVIGPCISKKNYEVKKEFFIEFTNVDKNYENFFERVNDQKYFFDLRGFINNEISNLNIKNVENIDMDTFSDREYFYSYRRSSLNREKDYGRCISVILMT